MKKFSLDISQRSQEIINNFSDERRYANQFRYKDSDKYAEILNNLYKKEFIRRSNNLIKIGNNPSNIKTVLEYISRREHFVDWMVDWCCTFDPRNQSIGIVPDMPFIPWKRQIEFIEFFYECYFTQSRALIEKSRDAGATWMFCVIFYREWRWEEKFNGGIGSLKLEQVDVKDNPKCIFEKIRYLYQNQPKWSLPNGFNSKINDKSCNIVNPENGSIIFGEGGDNIGRGGRSSAYLIDEAAHLEHPEFTDRALSRNTDSQFDLSTVNGMGHFYRKRHSGNVKVFVFDWRDDNRVDEEWYREQVKQHDPVTIAQEIDRDPHAAIENIFINPKHVRAAINANLPESGIVSAGLDVAMGGINRSALAIKKGCKVKVETYNFNNGNDLLYTAIDKCNYENVDYMNYDSIGVGSVIKSNIERTDATINFKYFSVLAGGEPSNIFYEEFGKCAKEIFYNAKAEWHYRASVLFRNTWEYIEHGIEHPVSDMVSIDNDSELIAQLTSAKKEFSTGGLMQVEGKKSLAARGIKSLDRSDAFIMSCIPQNAGRLKVFNTYTQSLFIDININFRDYKLNESTIYVCLYYDKDTGINAVFCLWDRLNRILNVYNNYHNSSPIPDDVYDDIMSLSGAKDNNIKLDYVFGNEDFFKSGNNISNILRKKGLRLKESIRYNEAAGIQILRSMFNDGRTVIDKVCNILDQDLRSWNISNDKPEPGHGLSKALCMIVTELREREIIQEDDEELLKPYSRIRQEIRNSLYDTEKTTKNKVSNENKFFTN